MRTLKRIILVFLTLLLMLSVLTNASAATPQSLRLPTYTQTDCEWDDNGKLISETAHDLSGAPALNSRGFYRAEYTWDEKGHPLTESYTGLNGEPVNADSGYARAEYTYENNNLVAEDRYAADGNRAIIPDSYSYRRDVKT